MTTGNKTNPEPAAAHGTPTTVSIISRRFFLLLLRPCRSSGRRGTPVYASANQIASNCRTGQIRESEAQSQEIPRYQSYVIDIQGHDAHLLITQYGNTVTVLNSMDVRTDLPAAIKKRIHELT